MWRWSHTPSGFLSRLFLLKTPGFTWVLHWIHKPDAEGPLHDHPANFLSLVLRGGYLEVRDKGQGEGKRHYLHLWWNYIRASIGDRHRITAVLPGTVTMCFMGKGTRTWGYHLDEGWQSWKHYNKERYGKARNQGRAGVTPGSGEVLR